MKLIFAVFALLAACPALEVQAARKGTTANAEGTPVSGGPEIDEIKQEITVLTGRIEELERAKKSEDSSGVTAEQFRKLTERLEKLEKQTEHVTATLEKMESQLPPPSPETLFKKAMTEFSNDNYEDAADLFDKYLKSKGSLKSAEEATFHRAESLFLMKNYKQAILEYDQLIKKFKKSKYQPKALYKTGLAFDQLGLKDDAKAFYKELVETFPKTGEAKSAQKLMAQSGTSSHSTGKKKKSQ